MRTTMATHQRVATVLAVALFLLSLAQLNATGLGRSSFRHSHELVEGEQSALWGTVGKTCGSKKCSSSAKAGKADNVCRGVSVSKISDGKFLSHRARCQEKLLCQTKSKYFDGQPVEVTATCDRTNVWIGGATCNCERKHTPRIVSNFQKTNVQHMNANIRTVCYERASVHSRLWLSTQTGVDTSSLLANAYYLDNFPQSYRLKHTSGRDNGGIQLDPSTTCHCRRIAGKTLSEITAIVERYAQQNGHYADNTNNCRHFAGWAYKEITGHSPTNFGKTHRCAPEESHPPPPSLDAFLAPVTPQGAPWFTHTVWHVV
eukprot:INCI8142.1.p1 GENE.INCI8142.1~~INCI8142.1.p1  ORF type:complete len:316 (+),score=35.52 INCI8142.1:64-1011(+)